MTDASSQRAWRLPLVSVGSIEGEGIDSGVVTMVGGVDAIRQSITILLTTTPGERIMRPSYGCPLHRLIFAPNDETTAGLAIHYVREAITHWEPRVEIVNLDAFPDPDATERLLIDLTLRIQATGQVLEWTYEMDLSGESE